MNAYTRYQMRRVLLLLNSPLRFLVPWPIRVWWSELWVRKDEFHWTLNMDVEAMSCMSHERRGQYYERLLHRRQIAHKRDL